MSDENYNLLSKLKLSLKNFFLLKLFCNKNFTPQTKVHINYKNHKNEMKTNKKKVVEMKT